MPKFAYAVQMNVTRDRGASLVAALMFSTIVLLVASLLLRVVLGRSRIYVQSRDHQYSQIAASSALSELNGCLYNAAFTPPSNPPSCPGGWTASSNPTSYTLTKSTAVGNIAIGLQAVWTGDASGKPLALTINATPQ